MGNSHSDEEENTISQDEVEDIKSSTQFSGSEVREMYQTFITDYPLGRISLPEFKSFYAKNLPGKDPSKFAEHIFRAYDIDGDGTIDFREFMCTLSITSRGTPEERMHWAFNLYDINGDGVITRRELVEILAAIFRMSGIKEPQLHLQAEEAALKIFVSVDKNHDDILTEAEFMHGAKATDLIHSLTNQAN